MKLKTVYISENGLHYETKAEAEFADSVHLGMLALETIDVDWDACDPRTVAVALRAAGYEITKVSGGAQALARTIQSIDWELLAVQKMWLVGGGMPETDGLVSLLDAIQDVVVRSGLVAEETVFPGSQE